MKSSREQGDQWAELTCQYLNQFAFKPLTITKNSGATHRDADFKNDHFAFDCKANAGGAFKKSLPFNELDKVTMQANETNRVGVLVVERENGKHTVALSLEDFARMLSWIQR